jgi:hypothetical protein
VQPEAAGARFVQWKGLAGRSGFHTTEISHLSGRNPDTGNCARRLNPSGARAHLMDQGLVNTASGNAFVDWTG